MNDRTNERTNERKKYGGGYFSL